MSLSIFETIKIYFSYAVIFISVFILMAKLYIKLYLSFSSNLGGNSFIRLFLFIMFLYSAMRLAEMVANIDIFILFYIVVPFLFSIALFLGGIDELALGIITIVKGLYYFCLVIISTFEYLYLESADVGKLALGFTLSITIFEAITAFYDGIKRISLETEKE